MVDCSSRGGARRRGCYSQATNDHTDGPGRTGRFGADGHDRTGLDVYNATILIDQAGAAVGVGHDHIARLQFGNPVVGTLSLSARVANRLARAAMGRWPEPGPFPEETRRSIFRRLLTEWAVITCAAALFFILVPLAVAPEEARPPILVAILLPAIVGGLGLVVKFLL